MQRNGAMHRWARVEAVIVAPAMAAAPAALALRTRCFQNVELIFPDGSSVHCDEFGFVERDDGSSAGWICS